jgi:hypothetical protein
VLRVVNVTAPANPLKALRRFARANTTTPLEQCDFCNLPLASKHRHLFERKSRKIICSCDACALRFDTTVGQYQLIPRDTRRLIDFQMSDVQWESFSLPIQLAFFYRDGARDKVVALYPSPGGATESLLPIASWEDVVRDNPRLDSMQRDVEALLVNRLNSSRQYFLAPIDVCYELVGLIRVHWRGFNGGDKVWQDIDQFFAGLQESAITVEQSRSQPTEVCRA